MNCEHVQELILTDYSDGLLTPKAERRVEDHIKKCPACTQFAQRVKQDALRPLEGPMAEPDPFIWQRIRNEIERGSAPVHAKVTTADILANFLKSFRPAAAVVGIFLLMAIAPIVDYHVSQRPSYMAYVMDADTDPAENDVSDGIEEYFL